MDNSALRNVFGSSASLAELSGDTTPAQRTGYSRFGLNERPPSHQMHTKTRKLSTPRRPLDLKAKQKPVKMWRLVLALSAFGTLQALLVDYHTPFLHNDRYSTIQKALSVLLFIVLSLLSGIGSAKTEAEKAAALQLQAQAPGSPLRPSISTFGQPEASDLSYSARHSRTRSRSLSFGANAQRPVSVAAPSQGYVGGSWIQSLTRGYGILLGLIYLSERLPQDSAPAWLLIAPSIWLVSDRSLRGLLTAATLALIGTLMKVNLLPDQHVFDSTMQGTILSVAATATTYFATSLMAGTVGRGLY